MMKVKSLYKRIGCMLLAMLMVFTAVPVNAFAVTEDAAQAEGLCAHHTAHEGCGYAEGVEGQPCTHIHDAQCGYTEGVEDSCTHVHDALCGYVAAVEAQPCGYECEACKAQAALDQAVALFAALPEAASITAETTEEEKDAVFAQLETAMDAYYALWDTYPEQAAAFEEAHLEKIQNALSLNDALTGNTAQTYAGFDYDYSNNSNNNVTITVQNAVGTRITGATVTVTRNGKTYEVFALGNGQYAFTKGGNGKSGYTITVSADGYETKTVTIDWWDSATYITLEEVEDLTVENLQTFRVYYIATGEIPDSYYGAGNAANYGPSGNNTPLVHITVDINKLRREYSNVALYQEGVKNIWHFVPNAGPKDVNATKAFWEAVWACTTEETKEDFRATGLSNDFHGYVLKKMSEGSQHCDGILTKTPPVYVIELYDHGTYFGGSVTDANASFKTMADVQQMFETHLGKEIQWTTDYVGTYYSNGLIYTATITQTNASSAVAIEGSEEIPYESKNSTNTYYLAQFNLTVAEGAEGYHTVTYTDGITSETIFADQVTVVETGNMAPAFAGTPQREGYHFKGWRQEGVSGLLTDAQIAQMTVNADLTFHAVWEAIPTSFTGTVNVLLNDSVATDITALMGENTKLYVSKTDGNYTALSKTDEGVYSAELENGTWYLYYSADGTTYTKVDEGALVINNAPASRELIFYSVSYDLNGGTATPAIPDSNHISGTQVAVSAVVPTKAGYRFTGWKAGETLYQPDEELTSSISNAYTLVAQWEKTVSVTINVTIDHQVNTGGYDIEETKDEIKLDLVSRQSSTDPYLEVTGKTLSLTSTSHDGYIYTFTKGNDDSEQEIRKTVYTSDGATFTELPGGTVEYSVVTSKTGYEIKNITPTQDAEGNWTIDVQLKYQPTNVDLVFSVTVDESVPESYRPTAAIVKVTYWDTATSAWEIISQQAGGEPGVRVDIDAATRSGSGSYPVWKQNPTNQDSYGYRILVSSFVYPNGTIVPASEVIEDTSWGDNVYLATLQAVTGGTNYGSLNGAYFADTVQNGILNAKITMDLYDVTFDATGGTIRDQTKYTEAKQFMIPALSNYTPVRDGGYIFEGWYTQDGTDTGNWGEAAISHKDLTEDITLYAKWRAPITITGTVYVDGSYVLDGTTHIIHDEDRAQTVMILLRKQGEAGVFKTATVSITYGADHVGTGTYTFQGLPDDGTVYYIEERAANYGGLYLNEPESLTVTTDFAAYTATDNLAELGGDKEAVVNAYLPFAPASFDLKYSVDATAIGSAFQPSSVEMLVTYDADHTITDPASWPVISQMVFGEAFNGDVLAVSGGHGNGSTSVWNSFPNGMTLYDYGIRVDAVTGEKLSDYADAPYTITYQAPAHRVSGGQSRDLIATLTPNQYDITYVLGVEDTAVTGMDAAPKIHTWSFDTDLSGFTPYRYGHEFLGWYDNPEFNGTPVTQIDAAVAEDITLYAKWYQMMDDVDLTVTIIHTTLDGTGEAGNYNKELLVQLTRAREGTAIYEDVAGQSKQYKESVWHTLGDDADEETLYVHEIFKGLAHDYAYSLNVHLDGYYVAEKTVTPVVDEVTGATTYQVEITLQYDPDLLNFSFSVEMAPGIDEALWPVSTEVKVTSWYDHPSTEIGLDWNTITQHESTSVTVTLDSTGKGTGAYPVWQWLDKGAGIPYYYRMEVISLHLSDGSVVMTNGTGSDHDVVYSGGGYLAAVETSAACVVPSGTSLPGAYGQGTSGAYTQIGEVKAVITIDRWDDENDTETGGDDIPDQQQALMLFRTEDAAKGTVGGATTQVFTLDQQTDGSYSKSVTPAAVTPAANTAAGYVFSHWTNAAEETVADPFQAQNVQGGKTYVYTAHWKYNDNLSYTVKYLEKDTNQELKTAKTAQGVTYGTQISAAAEVIAIEDYVFDYADKTSLTIGMGENVLTLYYAKDVLDDTDNNETDGDGIADYKQAVVKFVSGANGSVSGATTQVYTLEKDSSGKYEDTVLLTSVPAAPNIGYKLQYWQDTSGTYTNEELFSVSKALEGGKEYVYTAIFDGDMFSYTLEYYYDGVLTKTEPGAKTEFETVVTVDPDQRDGEYMLEKVEPASKTLQIGAVEEANVIRIYYAKDAWEDDIPDYRQALVSFVPANDKGAVTGSGVTQLFTFPEGATSGDVTPDLTNVTAQGKEGYAFDYWTKDNLLAQVNPGRTLANVPGGTEIVFKAHFAEDTWKDGDKTNEDDSVSGGDNIPDKYQAVVTYVVENGTWSDGTDANIQEVFTLYSWDSADCRWIRHSVTLGNTVPTGMQPDAGYTSPGYWEQKATTADDPVADTQVTQNAAYTYCYGERMKFNIAITVENGQATPNETSVQVTYGEDQTIAFQPEAGYALDSVTVDGVAAALTDGSYSFTDVVADHTIHVAYEKDSWKDSQQTPEEDEDSETGGDGIPDYRQAIVAFAADRKGTIEGTSRYVITLAQTDGQYKGQFTAKKDEVSAKANPGYKLAGWTLTKEQMVRALPTEADPYAPLDILGGNYYLYTAQFAEDMQDVTYPEADPDMDEPEKEDVPVQSTKYIQVKPNGGSWKGSTEDQTIQITGAYTLEDPVRDGYLFMGWTRTAGTQADVIHVFTAQWTKDVVGETPDTGDEVPDFKQAVVEFRAEENGTLTGKTYWVVTLPKTADGYQGTFQISQSDVSATADAGYKLDKWQLDAEAVDPYAPLTVEGEEHYVLTASFARDDKDVTYPEADPDKEAPVPETVPVQSTKYIQVKPNGGSWKGSTEDQTIQITGAYTLEDPVRDGYLFMGWTRTAGTQTDVIHVFTAQWEKDAVGKTDEQGKDIPDGIPDKYQKKVIFKVENGYWKQGAEADQILWLTLVDEDGNWDVNGTAKLTAPTGMYAKRDYEKGKWEVTPPATVKGTATETFTYRFSPIPVNDQIPETGDTAAESMLLSVTGMLLSAAALVLITSYQSKKRKRS